MLRMKELFLCSVLYIAVLLVISACGGSGGGTVVVNQADPGHLDTGFGNAGKVLTDISTHNDQAYAVAVQSDGKIVAVGTSVTVTNSDFAVVRYTVSGALDGTFGTGGIVTTPIGSGNDVARAAAIQADGKIVVAGYYEAGAFNKIAVVRYNTNGSLDSTFGAGGIVTTPIGSNNDFAYAVAVQSDGKIVVAGSSNDGAKDLFALVRYTAVGVLDTTFNTTGKVTTAIVSGNSAANGVAIQTNQLIVAAGYAFNGTNNDFAVARYNINGTLDGTFGTGGISRTPVGTGASAVQAVAIQSTDQKIVVVGQAAVGGSNNFAIARYLATGALDNGFGTAGITTTPIGTVNDIARAVKIAAVGKIVVAGSSYNGANDDFALARYNADGTLDTIFNGTGKVTTAVGTGDDLAFGLAIQPDGKIVAAGYSFNGLNNDFALTRYWP
ncbi:MAG: hypothetical protein EG826_08435 [Deltaproteobacteria bacterium]|nr:hypothetical protein [Deltaproteobacteria bacterium]